MKKHIKKTGGFTLVEMIVSLGLFTIILFAAMSSFLTLINADRKSRTTQVAMDNLNFALEDMSRRIKTGYAYDCDMLGGSTDCPNGAMMFNFTDQNGVDKVTYKLNDGKIERNVRPIGQVGAYVPATAPEITINSLKYIVNGTTSGDGVQPYVTILIKGTTNINSVTSSFNIQTTATQRIYDL